MTINFSFALIYINSNLDRLQATEASVLFPPGTKREG
jgi:hypothetical protein